MTTHHDDHKADKAKALHKAKEVVKDAMPAIDDIKEDIDSLKTNVVGLARNLRDVGEDKAREAAEYVQDRVEDLKATGKETLKSAEARIKKKPGQSVAIAFFAGILASVLFGRRSS